MDYVLSARNVRKGEFRNEPGKSTYLLVPPNQLPSPDHSVSKGQWVKQLTAAATWGETDMPDGTKIPRGDLVVFVHGYNNGPDAIMQRHRMLAKTLADAGFKGAVMSFDWPSASMAIGYLEDRHDAKKTAMQLVTDGIATFAGLQERGCSINVHLLGHSTGAYVIREAFDDADDAHLASASWMASQVVFIGGDISAESLTDRNPTSESLFRHCHRVTNYSNLEDRVLKLSNIKRAGLAPRVGRVGLPDGHPSTAVNIDCSDYFSGIGDESGPIFQRDQVGSEGTFCHSWHIGNKVFAADLFETLRGDKDRSVIPTRHTGPDGKLTLRAPA
jgi:hypothetical protein